MRSAEMENLTVVVVDDEDGIRAMLELTLRVHGFAPANIHLAGNGEEALAVIAGLRAAGGRVDAVIADLKMPRLDGLELFARLRADDPAGYGRMVRVLMTGVGMDAELAEIERAAAVAGVTVLNKPFAMSRFMAELTGRGEPGRA